MRPPYFDPTIANNRFLDGDYKAAFEEYTRGLNEYHSPICAFNLATMYQLGLHVPRDYAKAYSLYSAAAPLLDDGDADYNMALLHLRGLCPGANNYQAGLLMEESARRECIHAQYYLGVAHLLGRTFDPLNVECISRIPFPRIIPRNAHTLALLSDGRDTFPGSFVYDDCEDVIEFPDPDRSAEYLRKAAAQGMLADTENVYAADVIGDAMIARSLLAMEDLETKHTDRRHIFKLMQKAVLQYRRPEAVTFLMENRTEALTYGICPDRYTHMLSESAARGSSQYLIPAPPKKEGD
jgi:TPR repeat protein